MDDVAHDSKALFIIGSIQRTAPSVRDQAQASGSQRGIPLVVADPRQIDITDFAALHLRQRPGTTSP